MQASLTAKALAWKIENTDRDPPKHSKTESELSLAIQLKAPFPHTSAASQIILMTPLGEGNQVTPPHNGMIKRLNRGQG